MKTEKQLILAALILSGEMTSYTGILWGYVPDVYSVEYLMNAGREYDKHGPATRAHEFNAEVLSRVVSALNSIARTRRSYIQQEYGVNAITLAAEILSGLLKTGLYGMFAYNEKGEILRVSRVDDVKKPDLASPKKFAEKVWQQMAATGGVGHTIFAGPTGERSIDIITKQLGGRLIETASHGGEFRISALLTESLLRDHGYRDCEVYSKSYRTVTASLIQFGGAVTDSGINITSAVEAVRKMRGGDS